MYISYGQCVQNSVRNLLAYDVCFHGFDCHASGFDNDLSCPLIPLTSFCTSRDSAILYFVIDLPAVKIRNPLIRTLRPLLYVEGYDLMSG